MDSKLVCTASVGQRRCAIFVGGAPGGSAPFLFKHYPELMLQRAGLMENAEEVLQGLNFDAAGQPVSTSLSEQTSWLFQSMPTELGYRVLDEQGKVLLASAGMRSESEWLTETPAKSLNGIERTEIDGKSFAITTLKVSRGGALFYVQTATSVRFTKVLTDEKVRPAQAIVKAIVFLLFATLMFALALTLTVNRVLRPLRDASCAAAQIGPPNLGTRLLSEGVPSEIRPLIDAFNAALDRLQNGFLAQRQFLGSAAHELQTPLTLIRGQIELQPEIEDKELLFREIDLMARQVRQLLHLAEVSEPQNFSFVRISSVDVARDVLAYLLPKAHSKQVTLRLDAPGTPTTIWADRSALFILLKNILENAINVSTSGAAVTLIIDDVSIQILDEGPGIEAEHLPFLFKRFWRAPDTIHDGAGLGLAICMEIAVAHNWGLTANSSADGTRFMVSL
ncbi:sensor histidine kinase [Paraburkholderia dipogonis]|uniref:sensor histidine kinase n=1 Tax=Paraburkholderia dipogonis TaxID=1211383 RepID=UPI0036158A29